MDHGQVVEKGTHKELLQNPEGIYTGLWRVQTGGTRGVA